MNVFIFGRGRVGTVLAKLWSRSAVQVSGTWDQGEPYPPELCEAQAIVLAVRDEAVPIVAQDLAQQDVLAPGRVVLHCSGARAAKEALAPLPNQIHKGTFHPLVSVVDAGQAERIIPDAAVGVEGDPEAVAMAKDLARAIGARPLELTAEQMGVYHAAAVIASNHTVALWHRARQMLKHIGMDQDTATHALLGLIRSTLENVEAVGLPEALSGPVRRGDVDTVERNLVALAPLGDEMVSLYRVNTLEAVRAVRNCDDAPNDDALLRIERLCDAD